MHCARDYFLNHCDSPLSHLENECGGVNCFQKLKSPLTNALLTFRYLIKSAGEKVRIPKSRVSLFPLFTVVGTVNILVQSSFSF